jgi:plasmid stabilization system protein ParE
MRIKILKTFRLKFNKQLDYISQDKPGAARKFRKDILEEIKEIAQMPYKHRQSIHFNDSTIREFNFKGYLIIYRIKPDEIEVFGFIKYTKGL